MMVLVITGRSFAAEPKAEPETRVASGPNAVVPETSFDFGAVHEGEDVRHLFVIENKGDAPLVLLDVKTD